MKLTLLLLLALFATAQTSAPVRPSAGDPQHLLPTAPVTLHTTQHMSAYAAYGLVAKLLGIGIWPSTEVHTPDGKPEGVWVEAYKKQFERLKAIPVKLDLTEVSASDVLDAISSAAHQIWEVWPNPNGTGPVLVVVGDVQPQ